MDKPTCLCGEVMTYLMDNKRHIIWECQNCGRLLLTPNYADWQRWYFPEAGLKEGWDKPKGGDFVVRQHIIEDRQKRPLSEFAQRAVAYLEQHPDCDEVVQLADNITELQTDKVNPPAVYYELPQGYEYNFSGFYGQAIGIGRTGIRELHRRSR